MLGPVQYVYLNSLVQSLHICFKLFGDRCILNMFCFEVWCWILYCFPQSKAWQEKEAVKSSLQRGQSEYCQSFRPHVVITCDKMPQFWEVPNGVKEFGKIRLLSSSNVAMIIWVNGDFAKLNRQGGRVGSWNVAALNDQEKLTSINKRQNSSFSKPVTEGLYFLLITTAEADA